MMDANLQKKTKHWKFPIWSILYRSRYTVVSGPVAQLV